MIPPAHHSPRLLSLVIPCYNEEAVVSETVKRLKSFAADLKNIDIEFIFIDDGSRDQTRAILKSFAVSDTRIKIISFARNFGQQVAMTAGLDASRGDAVVLIDADLQDPPEVIHEMIKKWEEGYDVIYGTRTERPGESVFKLATARLFYRLLNKLSSVPIPLDTGDFRLMSLPVVDVLRAMPERDRFIRGMVSWVGFKQIALPYKRAQRFAGETKYPLKKMITFAFDGILSFSSKPLELSLILGMGITAVSSLGILGIAAQRFFAGDWVSLELIVLVAVGLLGGLQLLCLGILGQYIGRIYNEIKNRPLYIIQEHQGFGGRSPIYSRSPVVMEKQP
ncbi:MAG: glycosyltransferase [Opitutales bacterium]|nr:glycosyltransferase [Opitutales bacterium]